MLQQVLEILQIEKNICLTEQYEKKSSTGVLDFRNAISPKTNKSLIDVTFVQSKYVQVFEERHGFLPNLSILDLLFCTGPEAIIYLEKSIIN